MKRYLYNKKKTLQISISICLIHKIGTPLKLGPLNLHLTYMYPMQTTTKLTTKLIRLNCIYIRNCISNIYSLILKADSISPIENRFTLYIYCKLDNISIQC